MGAPRWAARRRSAGYHASSAQRHGADPPRMGFVASARQSRGRPARRAGVCGPDRHSPPNTRLGSLRRGIWADAPWLRPNARDGMRDYLVVSIRLALAQHDSASIGRLRLQERVFGGVLVPAQVRPVPLSSLPAGAPPFRPADPLP
jgi:hypothetical protein